MTAEALTIDPSEVKTEYAKPSDNPMAGFDQKDIQDLLEYRSNLMMDISTAYSELVKAIFKLPIHVVYRQNAFMFLDTADMWAKRGIDNVWDLPKEPESTEEAEATVEE